MLGERQRGEQGMGHPTTVAATAISPPAEHSNLCFVKGFPLILDAQDKLLCNNVITILLEDLTQAAATHCG